MRVATRHGDVHLGYCTNIHAGESWPEVEAVVREKVRAVKSIVAPDRAFGVGLRLSAAAATALSAPGELERFRAHLDEAGLYVFTINGFPYGSFHGTRVKEDVYRPDWLADARVAYSDLLARLLAGLLPGDVTEGSVSTVPVAFKPRIGSPEDESRAAALILRHVAALFTLGETTGKTIALALEPEPACHLETTAETVGFFQRQLFSAEGLARLSELTGLATPDAELALRRHLGVCFDACHMAVEWEEPKAALAALAAAGIAVKKVQISAGLEVDASHQELAPFAEGVYLHQVVERGPDGLRRWVDLPEALAAGPPAGPWRIHFHVPLFREALGPFRSTQPWLRELLVHLAAQPVCRQLEVETYTWDVLPPEFRQERLEDAIARELRWVEEQLV